MSCFTGLDIGGTKIAGGAFTSDGTLIANETVPTPASYEAFFEAIKNVVLSLDNKTGTHNPIGISCAGIMNHANGAVNSNNLPFLKGRAFRDDLSQKLSRPVKLANDANCMALAEAVDGAGKGYESVLGLIMGTGVGSGYIVRNQIVDGPNGLTGEMGCVTLPFPDPKDSSECSELIDFLISGRGLAALYHNVTGKQAEGPEIAEKAITKDSEALAVLDRFYSRVARALLIPVYLYDPHVIVISGGLHALPGLYEAVPKHWNTYSLVKNLKTEIVPAQHGPTAGLRGAAWLWRSD